MGGYSWLGVFLLLLFALPAFAEEADTLWTKSTYPDGIGSIVFTPDDQYVIYGGAMHNPVMLRADNGEFVKEFIGHKEKIVPQVAVSPDGHFLATARAGELIIWDFKIGEILKRIDLENKGSAASLNFSNDGKLLGLVLAGSMGQGTLNIYSAIDWSQKQTITSSGRFIEIEFSPDGRYFAVRYSELNDYFDIDFYDVKTFAFAFGFKDAHGSIINDICFSPDGKYLASASNDGKVKIWDVETKTAVREFKGFVGPTGLSFSPDYKYLVFGGGESAINNWYLYIFDIEKGELVRKYFNNYLWEQSLGVRLTNVSKDMKKIVSADYFGIVMLNARWEPSSTPEIGITNDTIIFPNPGNNKVTIKYNIKRTGETNVFISDIEGRMIKELFKGNLETGEHVITWDTSKIQSGTYYCNIQANNEIQTIKIVVNH